MKKPLLFSTVLLPLLLSAATIMPEEIAGSRRVDKAAGTIELAFGSLPTVFADNAPLRKVECDVKPDGNALELAVFDKLISGRPFTVALFNDGTDAKITLTAKDAEGKTLGSATATAAAKAWITFAFPAAAEKTALAITAASEGAEIRNVTLFSSFEQLLGGDEPIENISYRKFGAEEKRSAELLPGNHKDAQGNWNALKPSVRDGIPVGVIEENYQPLLVTEKSGVTGASVPVSAPGGAKVVYRTYGNPTVTLHPEDKGHRNSYTGKAGQWNYGAFALPVDELDTDRDGIWTGRLGQEWEHGLTLAQSYGKGEVDFFAILTANRIDLPENASSIAFEFRNAKGQFVPFTNPVPDGAKAVALLNIGPGATQLLWLMPDGWNGGRILRGSDSPYSLIVKLDSLKINE